MDALVKENILQKLLLGLYYYPEDSAFGKTPGIADKAVPQPAVVRARQAPARESPTGSSGTMATPGDFVFADKKAVIR